MISGRCRSFASFFLLLPAAFSQSLILEHATVIDATGAAPLVDVSVAINGGVISRIAKTIEHSDSTRVIDVTGKFVIPGLWDMHVHMDPQGKFLPAMVANGITGIREMYSGMAPAQAAAFRSVPDSPRIVVPGFLDGPLLRLGGVPPGAAAVGTADEARVAVRTLFANGADFLKVYNDIPREAYFAIASEAKTLGMTFAGHVPEEISPKEAAEAGQRSQEHLINILLACSAQENALRKERIRVMNDLKLTGNQRARELGFPNPEGLFDTYSQEKASALFATFARSGTWQTPTLVLLKSYADGGDNVQQSTFMQDLSQKDYDSWIGRIRKLLDRYKKLVGDMHRAGVAFLAGTDVNVSNPEKPGESLHEELELLVDSGLTPMEALQTATRNPGQYFGVPEQIGTVEAGKAADLVILDANPLEDIRNTRKIASVVLRGRYYPRTALDALTGN